MSENRAGRVGDDYWRPHADEKKIAIVTGRGLMECVFPSQIICFRGEGYVTYIWIEDPKSPGNRRRLMSTKNLKHFEDLVSPHIFMRACKNYLVNLYRILNIQDDTLILTNLADEPITLKGKFKEHLLERFERM